MPAGKPLKFRDVEALKKAIERYFAQAKKAGDPLTITGLALALGTCRQTLLNYEVKPEYLDIIKTAKLRVEHYLECQLHKPDTKPAGPIFIMKNMGWSDRIDLANPPGEKFATTTQDLTAEEAYRRMIEGEKA